ncbi:ATP-binding protein [Camelimonas lactis]|uniref:AAA+ ATPase superfamily predicted ATPase n=1 Tax=Camelimonas lactis TaxID=659006 RepID=A0A4R2GQV7_9HYPH|nr:ATP-binding protein [Camelimonas lactis]TCO12364.1 AAA+ ATPase superfamily predicted ATPase [Camelimonas lactis]
MGDKYNPFRPDKAAPPGMFAGRVDEIEYIQGCLRQTQNGNPKHFAITGERGIGKSSLVHLEQLSARGKITLNKQRFNFIVVSLKLRKDDDFYTIVERVAKELKRETSKMSQLGSLVLSSIAVLSRLEIAGVRIHPSTSQVDEAFSALIDDFELAILRMGDAFDGILLLLDEADAPPATANLGLFCKLLTEEMTSRQCEKVCIGLAGLPNLSSRLRESHESSLRLFHILNLKPLEPNERSQVLRMGLEDANKKNTSPVTIAPDAEDLIGSFSEGYPHFLQEFAYCAFEHDSDNNIDKSDFLSSLFTENGAFDQLGAKYFDKAYNTPASDDYRKVLHVMADGVDVWISRSDIIAKSKLKGTTVDNAIRALKAKDIIVSDESRPGRYRLPTLSFATWINIQKRAEAETV